MPTSRGRDRTIAALYGAATGRVAWDESLSVLSDYLEVYGITLDTYDFEQSAGTALATNLPPDPAILEYNEEFGRANPLIERSRRYLEGNYVFPASHFVRPEDFARTDLYNEVYRRLGIEYVAGMALDSGPEYTTHLTVIKPSGDPDFSERELARMRSIHAHVREAYAGFRHVQSTRRDLARLTSLWDAIEHAVIVVGAGMRVRFANRAAEAIAGRPRTFFAASDELHFWLGNASLVEATRSVLTGKDDLRHLSGLAIGEFDGLNASIFRLDNGEVVLVISDPVRVRRLSVEALIQRFSLTPAEAEIVREVIGGESLRSLAEDKGLSYETVRSQLKSAMTKNGWHRQTEMVADVFSRLLPFGDLDGRGL
ncbi:helix-turn-helix transcriptional regulator [Wenzhouxiangella sp. EGI_FJ10305]|uniref:helix-turn-helix transcriptional regulator n=1 Tax=Wenzhouxiangella sp. EGI_FJ10305 TaxID=3243768 RepID=UPI0035E1F36D